MNRGHDEAMQKILFQMSVLYACSGAKVYYPSYAFILSPSFPSVRVRQSLGIRFSVITDFVWHVLLHLNGFLCESPMSIIPDRLLKS